MAIRKDKPRQIPTITLIHYQEPDGSCYSFKAVQTGGEVQKIAMALAGEGKRGVNFFDYFTNTLINVPSDSEVPSTYKEPSKPLYNPPVAPESPLETTTRSFTPLSSDLQNLISMLD